MVPPTLAWAEVSVIGVSSSCVTAPVEPVEPVAPVEPPVAPVAPVEPPVAPVLPPVLAAGSSSSPPQAMRNAVAPDIAAVADIARRLDTRR
jgi:hypothetical protein